MSGALEQLRRDIEARRYPFSAPIRVFTPEGVVRFHGPSGYYRGCMPTDDYLQLRFSLTETARSGQAANTRVK